MIKKKKNQSVAYSVLIPHIALSCSVNILQRGGVGLAELLTNCSWWGGKQIYDFFTGADGRMAGDWNSQQRGPWV